ncbi:MAG: glycosyltransferase family 2 protein [Deltaproteobacteria bacterium]|nr:glycosyltransferase family 2 protein [Deltaproteobacteria bacterium]
MAMRITAAIPTKNRPRDLVSAVASILTQTRLPEELIIVDQSDGNESSELIQSMVLAHGDAIKLVYIHDTKISGLVEAKRVAAERFTTDILCYLEDDIVLERDYIEKIEDGFSSNSEMLGCCGVVTNLPPLPRIYCSAFRLFHRGIFADPRVGIHGYFEGRGHELIPSRALSGGLSAWRREVFSVIEFDVANEFHMLEDLDFSTRAESHFGQRFFINPNARLAHYMSPLNRDRMGPRQRRKVREFFTFYKKRRESPGAFFALLWLLCGLCMEAIFQSVGARSLAPLVGAISGLVDGVRCPLRVGR